MQNLHEFSRSVENSFYNGIAFAIQRSLKQGDLDRVGMKKLRNKLGEFWWASFVLFIALRFGDVVNAFTGLYVVPKFVSQDELGAVLPMLNFTAFLSLPLSIFITGYTKLLNISAVNNEWGKIKQMYLDVLKYSVALICLSILLVIAFHGLVFERLRIQNGMLGVVIVAAGICGSFAPLFTNTLQGLKKFRELSFVNIIAAPIRLIVILITMPIRPLTGYFVAHGSVPLAQIVASTIAIRKTVFSSSIVAESYLDHKTRSRFLRYLFYISLYVLPFVMGNCVETMIIRQRLSELDSAAFYMLSRIAEIGGYLGLTLAVVIFPFVSEQHEKGRDSDKLLLRVIAASASFSLLFAIVCYFSKDFVLSLLPNGETYLTYTKEYMLLIFIYSATAVWHCFANNEIAAERFYFLRYHIVIQIIAMALLFGLTGYGYFYGYLPNSWVDCIRNINACRLDFLLLFIAVVNLLRILLVAIHIWFRRKSTF